MFREYLQRLLECETISEIYDSVYNGSDGIDEALHSGKLSPSDYRALCMVIDRLLSAE